MDEIKRKAQELQEEMQRMQRDPSPHAPEIPYFLQQAIDELLAAIQRA